MPSLTSTLEDAIHRAIGFATERRHELATLEHLLLSLVDDPDASRVMQACAVDLDKLRTTLTKFIDNQLETLVSDMDGSEASPSTGFQRAIQRAAIHVQCSGLSEASGANVLVAIFNERESHAVRFLNMQDMTRFDAVNYLSHGVAKDPELVERRPRQDATEPNGERRPRQRKRRSGLRLTSTLEDAIHRAIGYANARKHELATLEHLLLALVDEPDASEVMQACAVDLPKLRTILRRFVDDELDKLDELFSDIEGFEASPSTGFQRVIQRAAIHVHSSGRSEVTGANVLVAIFNERESHAALFLNEQDMTRYDAVNYLTHGVAKDHTFHERRPIHETKESNSERSSRGPKHRSVPRLTPELKDAISRAVGFANARRHELATLDHLLLALVDETDAAQALEACGGDLSKLRTTLTDFIDTNLDTLVFDKDGYEASPSTGFQRVIQRAAIGVVCEGLSEISGANVLIAIINERESHAAHLLHEQGITRHDVVNFVDRQA